MINVSNRFKEVSRCPGREWHYKATLELANGEVMELDDHDFLEHGVRYTSCTSNPGEFNAGGLVADNLRIILNNYEGRFTHVDVDGSVLTLYIGLVVEQHWEHGKTLEWICIGRFYPETADMRQCQILLAAFDGTYQFDRPYSESKLLSVSFLALLTAMSICERLVSRRSFGDREHAWKLSVSPEL